MASEPLEIERLEQGILSFHGPLTMENVTNFMNAVRRETAPTMILDFSGVPGADVTTLSGIWCESPIGCMATGSYRTSSGQFTAAEEWDGVMWKIGSPKTPAGSTMSGLAGVSCPKTPYGCESVGFSEDGSGTGLTLAESAK